MKTLYTLSLRNRRTGEQLTVKVEAEHTAGAYDEAGKDPKYTAMLGDEDTTCEIEPKTYLKYKAIADWGRRMQSFSYYITNQQIQAEADGADVDVIYKRDDKWVKMND